MKWEGEEEGVKKKLTQVQEINYIKEKKIIKKDYRGIV